MRGKLLAIQAVLQDAEDRSTKDKALCLWLKKLKDVAYDIDDLLDDFQTVIGQRQLDPRRQRRNMVCQFFSFSNLSIFRYVMAHRMRSLKERVDMIAAERSKFQLFPDGAVSRSEETKRETFSMIDESKTVGRSDDKEEIMKLVLDDTSEEDVSVIPIVGMGGLGKTTLAQLIFNDTRVNDEVFDPRIWVCVSIDFNLKTIVQPILTTTEDKCDINNLESITSFLTRSFTDNKFLLVLDDIWCENQEEWERLKLVFKSARKGSKIIVTTRNQKVALMMRTVRPFYLQGLSEDDCWELFKRKAFEKGEQEIYPHLMRIGKEIVRKCGGVPLAANSLGSMLRFRRTEESWLAVRDSELWKLEQEDTILPSLKLSYIQMPSHLKQCFAYCSIFPKDYEIGKEKLIQQWIALGFVESMRGGSWPIEDKGKEYFRHLLWMSFLQELEEYGSAKYKMHHLLHDLAQSISRDEIRELASKQATDNFDACRYASLPEYKDISEIPLTILKKVRALHSRYSPSYVKSYSHAKCLRVLDLYGSRMKDLPTSIGKLKHLRYLDISSTCIETLPESICDIHNLQTLHLSNCHLLHMLPKSIYKLHHLRTLNLTACKFQALPVSIGHLQNLQSLNLSLCCYLEELPESIGKLKTLQVLNLLGCSKLTLLPESICCLQNLQSLNLSQCGFLQELPRSFGNLSNLQSLNLSQCRDLKALPESIGSMRRLQTLNISNCSHLSALPESLGSLQDLQNLDLSQYSEVRILPRSIGNLKNLQDLNLSWNVSLETLPETIGSLENLRSLILFHCWSLHALPKSLTNLVKLETLNLVGCKGLTELPKGMSKLTKLKTPQDNR
ncbi:putative disease resistance protein RGA3 isoform X1 [Typha latifolia]|uniref:putative disease resistance protein RGA3 isoform X1 n=1 Tax=Typha latifolia TaxID=4733 RepID=UPI003C2D201F